MNPTGCSLREQNIDFFCGKTTPICDCSRRAMLLACSPHAAYRELIERKEAMADGTGRLRRTYLQPSEAVNELPQSQGIGCPSTNRSLWTGC